MNTNDTPQTIKVTPALVTALTDAYNRQMTVAELHDIHHLTIRAFGPATFIKAMTELYLYAAQLQHKVNELEQQKSE